MQEKNQNIILPAYLRYKLELVYIKVESFSRKQGKDG
jgi:hypothetical protein